MIEIDYTDFIFNGGSDGCSGKLSSAWKLIFNVYPPFQECCYHHDYLYTIIGGNSADRWAADIDLFKCVYEYSPFWAYTTFFFVRIFGSMNCFWKWKLYSYDIPEEYK